MNPPVLPRRIRMPLFLGAFVFLCVIYAAATPIFEASDELWHFGMVDFIADTGQLPEQDPSAPETQYRQEGSQPPLYYAVSALLVRHIDRGDFEATSERNPHAQAGVPGAVGNKNMVLHDSLRPPAAGTALAVYLLRGFSILLGGVTVWMVYRSALLFGDQRVAWVAAGLTAFNPMFLFITASVNNDNLVTALNSLVIWQMLVIWQRGFDWRRSLVISVLIALASLSKLSGNVLVPVVALAALLVALREQDWRGFVVLGVSMAGVWGVFAGWWYLRNIRLYGELFGTRTMVEVAGPRLEPFTLGTLLNEFEGFRIAYWGLFGGVNVLTFGWFYMLMDLLVLTALVGLLFYGVRRRENRVVIGLLVLVMLLATVSLIAWTAQTYASQGRLLFPFVAAAHTLLALGLVVLLRRWAGLIPLSLAGFAVVVPFASIMPAYRPPPVIDTVPQAANPVYARYDTVELVGYEIPRRRYEPGDTVPVTVYWQVIEPSNRDMSLFLTPVDPAGDEIGKVDSFPGGGTLRTSTWEPGAIYPDHYAVSLREDATGRFNLRVQVGWWIYADETIIPVADETGEPLESVMLDAGGFANPTPLDSPEDLQPVNDVSFGGVIDLVSYTLDGDTLTLVWEAAGTPDDAYTVFAQVLDGENNVIAQGDAPPTLSTNYWRVGERYLTQHTLADKEGRVVVGWYHPADFRRLETDSPDNAYPLLP